MSLGSPAGFTEEWGGESNYVNAMYAALEDSGIALCISSDNSNSTANVNQSGYVSASNPDSGVIGSPSSYDAALSVASVNSYSAGNFTVNGVSFIYNDSVNSNGVTRDFAAALLDGADSFRGQYVYVGSSVGYSNSLVSGRIVLIERGGSSFESKRDNAQKKGAIGIIIFNNVVGDLNMSIPTEGIPACSISREDGLYLKDYSEGLPRALTISKDDYYYEISTFSSMGCLSDLTLKPDLSAPGGSIISSVPTVLNDIYAEMSGTSMASPNLAGICACVKQYVKERFPELTPTEQRDLTYKLLMSTAEVVRDSAGNVATPRKQGAGVADIQAATQTEVYLSVSGTNRVKIELGDDKNREGIYTLRFEVVNLGESAQVFDISVLTQTERVVDGLIMQLAHVLDAKTEIKSDAELNGKTLTVEGGQTVSVTIRITLTAADVEYMEDSFVNGGFVEGLVFLTAKGGNPDLSLPFMGFYGAASLVSIQSDSLRHVGKSTFENASSLNEAPLEGLEYMESFAFKNTAFEVVTIGDSLRVVGGDVFCGCKKLKEIDITSNANLFDINFLTDVDFIVTLANGCRSYEYSEGILYGKTDEGGLVILKSVSYENRALFVKEGVVKIAANAFRNNEYIDTVVFPESLEAIGANAFYGVKLQRVEFRSQDAPKLYSTYDSARTMLYANFVGYASELTYEQKPFIICNENASYNTYVYHAFFKR